MEGLGQALIVTGVLLAISLLVGAIALIIRAVALQRALAQVASGAVDREAALASTRQLARRMHTTVQLIATVSPALAFVQVELNPRSPVIDPHLWLGAYGIVSALTMLAYDVASAVFITLPMVRGLRGLTPRVSIFLRPHVRSALLAYPIVAVAYTCLAVSFANGWALGIWLSCAALVLRTASRALFGAHVQRFFYPSTPLVETEAPGLRDRIEQWAALLGVTVHEIDVQRTSSIGHTTLGAAGVVDCSVLLDEAVLTGMDWRQRDALIVWSLESNKLGAPYAKYMIVVMACTYGVIGLVLTVPLFTQNTVSAIVLVLLALGLASLLLQPRRKWRETSQRIDRLAAGITGDPLAVMVGVNSLTILTDTSRVTSDAPGRPIASLEARMRALDVWMQQPGPRAPWAYQLVPSRWPVTAGSYLLTAPFDSAPPPAPVPSAPYPTLTPAPAPAQ